MAEYVNIRIRKDTYERLKELSAGVPLVRFLDDACRHWSQGNKDEADALLDQLDNKSEEFVPGVVVDMSDWVDGEAPACCIDTIANSFKPGHICQDWVRLEYTDKNGLRRQNWFNKRTGEYEFSERWKKIKSEYEYQ